MKINDVDNMVVVVLAIVIVGVFLLSLAFKPGGGTTTTTTTNTVTTTTLKLPYCVETDGGIDFGVAGVTHIYYNGGDRAVPDSCRTSTLLQETSCCSPTDDCIKYTDQTCANGCVASACVP